MRTHEYEEVGRVWLEPNVPLDLAPNISCLLALTREAEARLGFEAPEDVSLHRKEVYDHIRQQRRGDGDEQSGSPVPR